MLRSRNSFFQEGNNQGMPMNPFNQMNQGMPNYIQEEDDLRARLAKVERTINRLDARITKLEAIKDDSLSSSMYMV